MGDAKVNVGYDALYDTLTFIAIYSIVKIGVNSIADITNGIYIGIGNSIVRNNSIPSYIVIDNLSRPMHIQASTI